MLGKILFISLVGLIALFLAVPFFAALQDVVFHPLTHGEGAPSFLKTALTAYSVTAESWLRGKVFSYFAMSLLSASLLLGIFQVQERQEVLWMVVLVCVTALIECFLAKTIFYPTEKTLLLVPFFLLSVAQGLVISKVYSNQTQGKGKY